MSTCALRKCQGRRGCLCPPASRKAAATRIVYAGVTPVTTNTKGVSSSTQPATKRTPPIPTPGRRSRKGGASKGVEEESKKTKKGKEKGKEKEKANVKAIGSTSTDDLQMTPDLPALARAAPAVEGSSAPSKAKGVVPAELAASVKVVDGAVMLRY